MSAPTHLEYASRSLALEHIYTVRGSYGSRRGRLHSGGRVMLHLYTSPDIRSAPYLPGSLTTFEEHGWLLIESSTIIFHLRGNLPDAERARQQWHPLGSNATRPVCANVTLT